MASVSLHHVCESHPVKSVNSAMGLETVLLVCFSVIRVIRYLFIHSALCGHLGAFQFGAAVNSAAGNILVHEFWCMFAHSCASSTKPGVRQLLIIDFSMLSMTV